MTRNVAAQRRTRGDVGRPQAGRQQRQANREIAVLFNGNSAWYRFLSGAPVAVPQSLAHIANPRRCHSLHTTCPDQLIEEDI